jgi:hypothetical protein
MSQKIWVERKDPRSPYLLDTWKPTSLDDCILYQDTIRKICQPKDCDHSMVPLMLVGPRGTGKHCMIELWMKTVFGSKHSMYGRYKIIETGRSDIEGDMWYEQTSWGGREYKWMEANMTDKDVYTCVKDWVETYNIQQLDEKKWVIVPNLDKMSEFIQKSFCTLIEKTETFVQWIFLGEHIQPILQTLQHRCLVIRTREMNDHEDVQKMIQYWNPSYTLDRLKQEKPRLWDWFQSVTLGIPKIGKLAYMLECEDTPGKYPYEYMLMQKAKKYWLVSMELPLREVDIEEMRAICHGCFHLHVPLEYWYRWLLAEGLKVLPKERHQSWIEQLKIWNEQNVKVFRELFAYETSWVQCQYFHHRV